MSKELPAITVEKHYILDTWNFHVVLPDGTTRSGTGFRTEKAARDASEIASAPSHEAAEA